ncbi:OB-fold-containig protein [Paraflavitalea pollutisoli]|uniref:OB-fold-containig protein n=1 Tax=Paraflavitalea pollutisoli TaxID=3034143 RepID=UPI0023EC87DD|nr:OB-fold-containig protein [Paraflavitalea sp. H1-2-19X]
MTSFVHLLFNPLSNAIMTVLSGITAIYWLFTFIAGGLFHDGHHIDHHLDIHGADIDTDTDADLHDSIGDKSFLHKTLDYVNIGKVPFMIILSTFKFIAWIVTLISSIVLDLAAWGWKSVLILAPVSLIAYFLTRYATKPLVKIYYAMGYNGEEAHELLGRTARMKSTIAGDKIGAAELQIQSDVIRINVKSKTGEAIQYNAEVMIADESADRKYYYVVPEINLNNIV